MAGRQLDRRRPLWRALALARGPEGDRAAVRPWLAGIARTWTEHLARLHATGWAHADVQPTNTLVTHGGHAAVIDYALACGPVADRRVPYRGALTHTTAPELATAILSTPAGTHIPTQPAADIWSLGASLFWCWTGHRPVLYDDTTDRLEELAAIAKGTTTALRDVRPWASPEFEDTITACPAPNLERLEAMHHPDNPASGRVLAKVGFIRTGTSDRCVEDGPAVPYQVYAMQSFVPHGQG
ncbi:hypothetical protein OG436_39740 (plasmid) [Streptomyces caniferus]|uniref:protein kinase domain-containing protein n=1 Tax=Streptomyces caniferus TaxID=285557 RepID=UPI002E2B0DBB|nr:phosphotransferase [Streptomyces caniferus]